MKNIAIVRSCGKETTTELADNLQQLRTHGFNVWISSPNPQTWKYTSASIQDRLLELNEALVDDELDVIWCCRGGYGASDLIGRLDWQKLRQSKPKTLVGFSDFCAIQSAFSVKLNWPAIHGPMPGTRLWGGVNAPDVTQLIGMLKGQTNTAKISLETESSFTKPIEGEMFGGCLTVMSSLIGTEFFPKSLAGKILFLEDVNENPGRIVRSLTQWQQSGVLKGVAAIVLGNLFGCLVEGENKRDAIQQPLQERFAIPVFLSEAFGHTSPNFPIPLGAQATIQNGTLVWRYAQHAGRLQQS
jgi:muramoyltetrapeptide carboxypeptidase